MEVINTSWLKSDFWLMWKQYKKEEHRFSFKSEISEWMALKKLYKISEGDQDTAKEIIEESIANGWKGFFELKNNHNGKPTQDDIKRKFDENYAFYKKAGNPNL